MGRLLAKRYQLRICLELEQWAGLSCKGRFGRRTCCHQISPCQSRIKLRVQERFEEEAKTCASVKSIHIVRVMDYGVDENNVLRHGILAGEDSDIICLNLSLAQDS